MISITNFREGAILNHRHGRESRDALTVTVEGVNSFGAPVRVNGVPADCDGLRFRAEGKNYRPPRNRRRCVCV